MNKKQLAVAFLLVAAAGVAAGRYINPRVEIKVEEHTKEVEVVKRDVKTVIKQVERPDGTKETETTIEDKTRSETQKESDKESSKIVSNEKAQWKISAHLVPKEGLLGPVYGASVERRILGPIFAGAFGNTDKVFGLSVGIEL